MVSQIQKQSAAPGKVAGPVEGKESEAASEARAPERAFRPVLAIGVLASRWMRSYATPCHARGSSL